MDEEFKDVANKLANKIYRKVRRSVSSDFYRFGKNMGLGADGTVTKFIDKIAEDVAVKHLKKSKVDINLLSEEVGIIDNDSEYTIVLDPVDGTRNAYRGIPFYSVSVAVGKKSLSDVEYGIVKNIPNGDVYSAEKNIGAFLNNKKLVVPNVPDKQILSSLSLGKNYSNVAIDLAKKEKVRSLGSASLEMCMVATGALDYYLVGNEYIRVFDIAASTLILREAGGFVKNVKGKDLDMDFNLEDRSSIVAACSMDLIKKIIL